MSPDIRDLHDAALDLAHRGQLDAAQAKLTELLTLDPEHAAGWSLRGALDLQRGRPDQAIAAYDRAVALGDDHAATHLGRGLSLLEFERNADAAASLAQAAARDPRLVRAHTGRSRALHGLGRSSESLESADRALALEPANPEAWRRRGLALFQLERCEEALAAFRAVPASGSAIERSDVLADIGFAHEGLGQNDQALAAYDEAVRLAPGARLAPFRRSLLRLLLGDFAGGWEDYETRWRRHAASEGVFHMAPHFRERLQLSPSVDDLAGQRVLVVAEQGVGDVIMFASVLPDLAAGAAHVTLLVEPRLLALFSASFPEVAVVAGHGPHLVDLERIDRVVALGSLPHAFRRDAADFPGQPYLQPRALVTQAWRTRLGPRSGRLRVGVSWRGGAAVNRGAVRSMPLDTLHPVLERADVDAVSLQYGETAAEIAAMNATLQRPVVAFPAHEIDDFEQLAGLIGALDVVVTVQTTVAHLAGALGRPGLVMIPQRAEWRYGREGSTMPWYASLRLFRQAEAGDWPAVVRRVSEALDEITPRIAD